MMNAEGTKRLEEIKNRVPPIVSLDDELWLIARLEAEARENERLQEELRDRRLAEMDRLENLTIRAEGAEAERDAIREEWTRVFATLRKEREAAEARCAELEGLFSLQQTRWAEAREAWREDTGKHDVSPDLGELLTWLMARPAALEDAVWDEVLDVLKQAWSQEELVYNESPCELIMRLVNERDALEARVRGLLDALNGDGALALEIGSLDAIAWHLEQGGDNGGIHRMALALFLRAVAVRLKTVRADLAESQEGKDENHESD